MKSSRWGWVGAGTVGLGLGALVCLGPAYSQKGGTGGTKAAEKKPAQGSQEGVKLIKEYKSWVKVNSIPVRMEPAPAWLCAATPAQRSSPHVQKYITVYVNKAGREAMTKQKKPHYPVGTVIVKEKLPKPDSPEPELLTVMVRHEKGYNPKNGDWEYLVFNGKGTEVTAQGKLEKCQSCHRVCSAADYVFREYYLPAGQRSALK